MSEPLSITRSGWYQLLPPPPKPEIWDLTVGVNQHLGWRRCWAFVNSRVLGSREISIVWSIAYAMKEACERVAAAEAAAAYEQGWNDACQDHIQQRQDPTHPIGDRKSWPKEADA